MKNENNKIKDLDVKISISQRHPGGAYVLFPVIQDLREIEALWVDRYCGDCISPSGTYYIVLSFQCNPYKRLGKNAVLSRLGGIRDWFSFGIFYIASERAESYFGTSEGYTVYHLDKDSISSSIPDNLIKSTKFMGMARRESDICLVEILKENYG